MWVQSDRANFTRDHTVTSLCTGVLLIAPTCASMDFVEKVGNLRVLGEKPQDSDQRLFNENLVSFRVPVPSALDPSPTQGGARIWFEVLNPTKYPNGYRFFSSDQIGYDEMVLLHYNWIYGRDAKKKRMIETGLWLLAEEG